MVHFRAGIASLAWALTAAPVAAEQKHGTVVPLSYGMTAVDLTGRRIPASAVLARRENYNAHSFDVLTIYIKASPGPGTPPFWQLVPAFDDEGEHVTLHASGGADCLLHDFRLVSLRPQTALQLVVADRDFDDGYTSVATVHFRFYALKLNAEQMPGRPVYFFELQHADVAKRPHCDVGAAFAEELELKPYIARDRFSR